VPALAAATSNVMRLMGGFGSVEQASNAVVVARKRNCLPTTLCDVRFQGQAGKHMLAIELFVLTQMRHRMTR